jgi:hypothetical protein
MNTNDFIHSNYYSKLSDSPEKSMIIEWFAKFLNDRIRLLMIISDELIMLLTILLFSFDGFCFDLMIFCFSNPLVLVPGKSVNLLWSFVEDFPGNFEFVTYFLISKSPYKLNHRQACKIVFRIKIFVPLNIF